MASGYIPSNGQTEVEIMHSSVSDWRADLLQYLKDLARGASKKTRGRALRHVLIGDELYCHTLEGLLLKCLGPDEIRKVMYDVHEGTCGTHQVAHKMKWLIRRASYYCQPCSRLVSSTTRGAQTARSLELYRWLQLIPFIRS